MPNLFEKPYYLVVRSHGNRYNNINCSDHTLGKLSETDYLPVINIGQYYHHESEGFVFDFPEEYNNYGRVNRYQDVFDHFNHPTHTVMTKVTIASANGDDVEFFVAYGVILDRNKNILMLMTVKTEYLDQVSISLGRNIQRNSRRSVVPNPEELNTIDINMSNMVLFVANELFSDEYYSNMCLKTMKDYIINACATGLEMKVLPSSQIYKTIYNDGLALHRDMSIIELFEFMNTGLYDMIPEFMDTNPGIFRSNVMPADFDVYGRGDQAPDPPEEHVIDLNPTSGDDDVEMVITSTSNMVIDSTNPEIELVDDVSGTTVETLSDLPNNPRLVVSDGTSVSYTNVVSGVDPIIVHTGEAGVQAFENAMRTEQELQEASRYNFTEEELREAVDEVLNDENLDSNL